MAVHIHKEPLQMYPDIVSHHTTTLQEASPYAKRSVQLSEVFPTSCKTHWIVPTLQDDKSTNKFHCAEVGSTPSFILVHFSQIASGYIGTPREMLLQAVP